MGPKDKHRIVHETVTNHVRNDSLSEKKEAGQGRVITVLACPRHLNKMENVLNENTGRGGGGYFNCQFIISFIGF